MPPTYQAWGNVFTAPSDANVLTSLEIFVSRDTATEFGIVIYAFSATQGLPTGAILYQSPTFLISSNFVSGLIFPNLNVTPGNQYIAQVIGDGVAGIAMTAATSDVHLYEKQSNIGANFFPFGDYAFSTTITFDQPIVAVPLGPSTLPMMILGFAGVAFMAYRRKSKPASLAA